MPQIHIIVIGKWLVLWYITCNGQKKVLATYDVNKMHLVNKPWQCYPDELLFSFNKFCLTVISHSSNFEENMIIALQIVKGELHKEER